MKILDKEIKKRVEYKLGNSREEFTEEELSEIEDLSLMNLDYADNLLNIDLKEIEYLKKLKFLTLKEFEINNQTIGILNKCENLKYLCLNICDIKDEFLEFYNLNQIVLNYCNIEKLNNIIFPQEVKVVTGKIVDLNDFNNIKDIKKLTIQGAEVLNFKRILDFENLETLNLDGSNIDNKEVINKIMKKVNFSQQDNCLPIV